MYYTIIGFSLEWDSSPLCSFSTVTRPQTLWFNSSEMTFKLNHLTHSFVFDEFIHWCNSDVYYISLFSIIYRIIVGYLWRSHLAILTLRDNYWNRVEDSSSLASIHAWYVWCNTVAFPTGWSLVYLLSVNAVSRYCFPCTLMCLATIRLHQGDTSTSNR